MFHRSLEPLIPAVTYRSTYKQRYIQDKDSTPRSHTFTAKAHATSEICLRDIFISMEDKIRFYL
jgi:hypothetical protein